MRTGLLLLAGLAAMIALAAGARWALAPKPPAPAFTVLVQHSWSLAEAEQKLAAPIERALTGLDGITTLRTHIDGQQVTVRAELKPGLDVDAFVLEAMHRVSPERFEDSVPTFVPERAFLQQTYLTLESDRLSGVEVDDLAEEKVRLDLLRTPGFREVEVCGPGRSGLMIELDPERLGGPPLEVVAKLLEANRSLPATVRNGEFVVRGISGATAEQYRALDLGGGRKLTDVAVLSDRPIGARCLAYRQGRRAIGLRLRHLAETNPEAIHAVTGGLPAGLTAGTMPVGGALHFVSPAPIEKLEQLMALAARQSPSLADAVFELRPSGSASLAVAYLPAGTASPLSLHLPDGLQLVRIDGYPVRAVTLLGPDSATVSRAAIDVEKKLRELGVLASSRAPLVAEVRVEPDRARLADLGLSVGEMARSFQLATDDGTYVGALAGRPGHEVRVRLPKLKDEDLALVKVGKGASLAEVARLTREESPAWIDREDGLRVVRFQTTASVKQVEEALKALQLPAGVVVRTEQGR